MSGARILLVEDEAILAMDLQDKLTDLGYRVLATTSSGEAAVRMAAELNPDLVLMDIRLNGIMDGIEAGRQIGSLLQIPIVFMSAYSDEATMNRARSAQPYDYLIKPFGPEKLNSTIVTALRSASSKKLKDAPKKFPE